MIFSIHEIVNRKRIYYIFSTQFGDLLTLAIEIIVSENRGISLLVRLYSMRVIFN